MPLDANNVLAHAVASGTNPTVVFLVISFFTLVWSEKATRNTVRILRALARVIDAGARRKK